MAVIGILFFLLIIIGAFSINALLGWIVMLGIFLFLGAAWGDSH